MTPLYRGPWMDERQPGKWEDCVAASGVNMLNAVMAKWAPEKRRPITDAERESLRIASGDTAGGMSLESLAAGMLKRYGHKPRASSDWASMTAPKGGDKRWWVVIGNFDALPKRLRRWSPAGKFAHAVTIGPDKTGTRWLVDPQMNAGFKGESITMPELKKFMATQGYKALSFAIEDAPGTPQPAPPLPPPAVDSTPYTATDVSDAVTHERDRWLAWLQGAPK